MSKSLLIVPPPEIRKVVDKTAAFVARQPTEEKRKHFESRILSNPGQAVKFTFLKDDDPYHAYYVAKIAELREAAVAAKTAAPAAPAAAAAAPAEEKLAETNDPASSKEAPAAVAAAAAESEVSETGGRISAALLRALKRVPKNDPPRKAQYLLDDVPSLELLPAAAHDLIRLTAQHAAVAGGAFMGELAHRESRNEEFYFLRPTHSLHSYFRQLVERYERVANPSAATLAELRARADDRLVSLDKSVHVLEYQRKAEALRRSSEAEAEATNIVYQSIDWNDFVVVATVDFAEDEVVAAISARDAGGEKSGLQKGLATVAGEVCRGAPFAKHKELQKSFRYVKRAPDHGSLAWLSHAQARYVCNGREVHYVFDPTGWAIQLDVNFSRTMTDCQWRDWDADLEPDFSCWGGDCAPLTYGASASSAPAAPKKSPTQSRQSKGPLDAWSGPTRPKSCAMSPRVSPATRILVDIG